MGDLFFHLFYVFKFSHYVPAKAKIKNIFKKANHAFMS